MKVCILTISDRASKSEYEDKSGISIRDWIKLNKPNYTILHTAIVPDEEYQITNKIKEWVTNPDVNFIITTGGTGLSQRDVTRKSVSKLLIKEAIGITTAIISKSIQITPFAMLSNPIAGVLENDTFIITLPGSSKACIENLDIISIVIDHVLEQVTGVNLQNHPVNTSNQTKVLRKPVHNCIHHSDINSINADSKHGLLSDSINTSIAERSRISKFKMVQVDDAINYIIKETADWKKSLNISMNQLMNSFGKFIVAENIIASSNVPNTRVSIVDGYAVSSKYPPGIYILSSSVTAGETNLNSLISPETIVRVTTGAPVPDEFDAVIMVEDTKVAGLDSNGNEHKIELLVQASEGMNIRPLGSDVQSGDLLIEQMCEISAFSGELGLLMSSGIRNFSVYKKPKIAVMSTGNEIIDLLNFKDKELPFGKVFDCNRPSLLQRLKILGFETLDLGVVEDKLELLSDAFFKGLKECDVIISTGGVSMGELDLVKRIIEHVLNGKIHFGRVNMKPGKPTTFATCEFEGAKKFIFGLAGNPVSASVCFELFVIPALKSMSGYPSPIADKFLVKINDEIPLDLHRPEYHRVWIDQTTSGVDVGVWTASSTGNQLSSRLKSICKSNGLLITPSAKEYGQELLEKGSFVPFMFFQTNQ